LISTKILESLHDKERGFLKKKIAETAVVKKKTEVPFVNLKTTLLNPDSLEKLRKRRDPRKKLQVFTQRSTGYTPRKSGDF